MMHLLTSIEGAISGYDRSLAPAYQFPTYFSAAYPMAGVADFSIGFGNRILIQTASALVACDSLRRSRENPTMFAVLPDGYWIGVLAGVSALFLFLSVLSFWLMRS